MIVGIILAAGSSTRMGTANKLMLPIHGQSLLQRVVEAFLQSEVDQLMVVLGHESAQVRLSLHDLPVIFVENPKHLDGMGTSISAGVQHLPEGTQAFMIAQGDTPNLDAQLINGLIECYREAGFDDHGKKKFPIVAPAFRGKRGNPILFDQAFAEKLSRLDGHSGAKKLIDEYAEHLTLMPITDDAYFLDLDTPEAYQAFLDRNR